MTLNVTDREAPTSADSHARRKDGAPVLRQECERLDAGGAMLYRVRVTLLGPIAAEVDGVVVPLGGRRQRAVFAILALSAGRVVSLDHLARVLWQDEPPAQATMALQSLVSRLRRVLALQGRDGRHGPQILTRPPGWVLEMEPEDVDVTRFRTGVAEGRRLLSIQQPAASARVLGDALRLWSAPSIDELEIARFAEEDAVALEQARLEASELLFAAHLASGATQDVVEAAQRFVASNPFRERAWISLSLALYRSGRQADALAAIAELRTALADGLGLDPSAEVRELEHQILVHDTVLDAAPGALVEGATTSDDELPMAGSEDRLRHVATEQPAAAPAEPIVGRTEVFAILDEVLRQAAQGRGRVMVIEGSAGIGKSTILRTLDGRAASHGGVTVQGAGVVEAPAFWPWVVAVRDLVSKVPGLAQPPSTSALAVIDPALFPSPEGLPDGGDPVLSRTRLYRAAIDLFMSARRLGPVTVAIDDVQNLDDSTAGLLAVAIPELIGHGVLFILGLRTDDSASDEKARRLLERVPRDALVRVRLANLNSDEVAETIAALTRSEPDPAVSQAIWSRSRGNPLFVTELVRLLISEDRLDREGVYAALPSEVRDVLRRRLDRLPAATVSLLAVVALVGHATDVALLARITDSDEDEVVDASESAVVAALLVDDAQAPGRYTLSHDLVRQTLVESIVPARRVRLHARIGRALEAAPERAPDQVVEIARHLFLAASVVGAAAALPFVIAAADDALSRLALGQAEQLLTDTLTLAALLPSAKERTSVEMQARSSLAITRIYATGLPAGWVGAPATSNGPTSMSDAGPSGADGQSGSSLILDPIDPTAWFVAMMAAGLRGAYQRMAEEAARALTPDLTPETAAVVRLELGLAHLELGDLQTARTHLETAREVISHGEPGALVLSLAGPTPQMLLGIVAHFQGDEQRADAMMAEAMCLADTPRSKVLALFGKAWLDAYRGDAVAASEHAKACGEVAGEYPAYIALSRMLGGWADAVQGDASGVQRAGDAFKDYTADGTLLHVPVFLMLRAEAHLCTGDSQSARTLVAQSRSVASMTKERCLGPRLSALAADLERAPV